MTAYVFSKHMKLKGKITKSSLILYMAGSPASPALWCCTLMAYSINSSWYDQPVIDKNRIEDRRQFKSSNKSTIIFFLNPIKKELK